MARVAQIKVHRLVGCLIAVNIMAGCSALDSQESNGRPAESGTPEARLLGRITSAIPPMSHKGGISNSSGEVFIQLSDYRIEQYIGVVPAFSDQGTAYIVWNQDLGLIMSGVIADNGEHQALDGLSVTAGWGPNLTLTREFDDELHGHVNYSYSMVFETQEALVAPASHRELELTIRRRLHNDSTEFYSDDNPASIAGALVDAVPIQLQAGLQATDGIDAPQLQDARTVSVPTPITIDLGPDLTIAPGQDVVLTAETVCATDTCTIWWAPEDVLGELTAYQVNVQPDKTTPYHAILSSEDGQVAVDVIWIFIEADLDNDGIPIPADLCPDTTPGAPVNAAGCSLEQLDSDDDQVSDLEDDCPGTAQNLPVNDRGCSLDQADSDGDGVSDLLDACPSTSTSINIEPNGCAWSQLPDSDVDGIPDVRDLCPYNAEERNSDFDGDGIGNVCESDYREVYIENDPDAMPCLSCVISGPDNRTRVPSADLTQSPWNAIGKIDVCFSCWNSSCAPYDGDVCVSGTGAAISSSWVLTANHVAAPPCGCSISAAIFTPAMTLGPNGVSRPYGEYAIDEVQSYGVSQLGPGDVALLHLQSPLPSDIEPFSVSARSSAFFAPSRQLETAGYPADWDYGRVQVKTNNNGGVLEVSPSNGGLLRSWHDTRCGQSGSPLWADSILEWSPYTIVAVNSFEYAYHPNGDCTLSVGVPDEPNGWARITGPILNWIRSVVPAQNESDCDDSACCPDQFVDVQNILGFEVPVANDGFWIQFQLGSSGGALRLFATIDTEHWGTVIEDIIFQIDNQDILLVGGATPYADLYYSYVGLPWLVPGGPSVIWPGGPGSAFERIEYDGHYRFTITLHDDFRLHTRYCVP